MIIVHFAVNIYIVVNIIKHRQYNHNDEKELLLEFEAAIFTLMSEK